VREGGIEVLHLNAIGAEWRDLVAAHGRALRYLARAAGARQLAPLRSTVVWLPGLPTTGCRSASPAIGRCCCRRRGATAACSIRSWRSPGCCASSCCSRCPRGCRCGRARALPSITRSRRCAGPNCRRRRSPPRRSAWSTRRARHRAGCARQAGACRRASRRRWRTAHGRGGILGPHRPRDRPQERLSHARFGAAAAAFGDWPDDRLPPAVLESLRRYAGDSAVDELLAAYVGR
jgi:hypothetical protein